MHCIVVDEDINAQDIYASILDENKDVDKIAIFGSPKEALAYLEVCKSHCVVFCEISFKDISGIEFCRLIKDIDPNIIVVFVTENLSKTALAFTVHANGYIQKPITHKKINNELKYIKTQITVETQTRIFASTFGIFELYVDNKKVHFTSNKAKELLALLIDRRGGSVTCEQAISALWEDRPYDPKTRSLCRMAMTELRRSLDKVGARNLLVENRNSKSVDPLVLSCDYYDFLKEDTLAMRKYKGEYMSQYYWATDTTGMLDMEKETFLAEKGLL